MASSRVGIQNDNFAVVECLDARSGPYNCSFEQPVEQIYADLSEVDATLLRPVGPRVLVSQERLVQGVEAAGLLTVRLVKVVQKALVTPDLVWIQLLLHINLNLIVNLKLYMK